MWGWRSEGGKQFGREPGPASSHHQQGVVEGETESTREEKRRRGGKGERGWWEGQSKEGSWKTGRVEERREGWMNEAAHNEKM